MNPDKEAIHTWSSEIYQALERLEYCTSILNFEIQKRKSENTDELQKSVNEIENFLHSETFTEAFTKWLGHKR